MRDDAEQPPRGIYQGAILSGAGSAIIFYYKIEEMDIKKPTNGKGWISKNELRMIDGGEPILIKVLVAFSLRIKLPRISIDRSPLLFSCSPIHRFIHGSSLSSHLPVICHPLATSPMSPPQIPPFLQTWQDTNGPTRSTRETFSTQARG